MASFSIGGAASSGLSLIRERPVAVLIWGLAYFAIAVAPMLLVGATAIPDFIKTMKLAGAEPGDDALMRMMVGLQAKMILLQSVQFLGAIAAAALIYSAVFRAVLEPHESRRWYLRLSAQEGWVAFVFVVTGVIGIIAMFAAMIPFGIIAAIIGAATGGQNPSAWLILVPIGLAVLGVVIWLILRLVLALPMSFAERNFRLFESWSLTKGHAGAMALTFLIVMVLFIVIEIVFVVIGAMAGGALVAASGVSFPSGGEFPKPPAMGWAPFAAIAIALLGLLYSLFAGVVHAIGVAPIAYIYRELTAAKVVTAPGT